MLGRGEVHAPGVCPPVPTSMTDMIHSFQHEHRKDFLIGGAQIETTHRVVSNLYSTL